MSPMPWVLEAVVATLLLASGALSIVAAVGLVRLKGYFTRLHAPALASTGGVWCVTAATIVYFSVLTGEVALYPIVVSILLAVTAPVATLVLARTGLFRGRLAGKDVPAAFGGNPDANLVKHDPERPNP